MDSENDQYEQRFLNSMESGRCFLCGSNEEITEEHIFPRWLLKRYRLYNEKLCLVNETLIPYRKLKIPACADCNQHCLGNVEKEVARASMVGYDALHVLPETTLVLWLGKILYGLLRKESELLADRSDSSAKTIIPPEMLRSLKGIHDLLQHARQPITWLGRKSWTLFRFRCIPFGDERDFDFLDAALSLRQNIHTKEVDGRINPSCAMRLGESGIILSLDDGGRIGEFLGRDLERFAGCELHPAQFDEICARTFYDRSTLLGPGPSVTIYDKSGDLPSAVLHLDGYSVDTPPPFREFNPRQLAWLIGFYMSRWRMPADIFFKEPRHVLTLLEHPDGSFLQFTRDQLLEVGYGLWTLTDDGAEEDAGDAADASSAESKTSL